MYELYAALWAWLLSLLPLALSISTISKVGSERNVERLTQMFCGVAREAGEAAVYIVGVSLVLQSEMFAYPVLLAASIAGLAIPLAGFTYYGAVAAFSVVLTSYLTLRHGYRVLDRVVAEVSRRVRETCGGVDVEV